MKRNFYLIFLLLAGCQYLTPGKLSSVQTTSLHPRAGNVYLIRGWIGVFSAGIDSIGDKLTDNGVRAVVYQDDQWRSLAHRIAKEYQGQNSAEPLVLVGHSYGADDVVRVARQLDNAHVPVDLLVTLDPVTPPQVPPNVRHCVNLYQSNGVFDYLPFLRGVPLKSQAKVPDQIVNGNLRGDRKDLLEPFTNHFNIEKKHKVQQEVVRIVSQICPPRPQWLAQRNAPELPSVSGGSAMSAGAKLQPENHTSLTVGGASSQIQRGN
jgi:hypothetical protein